MFPTGHRVLHFFLMRFVAGRGSWFNRVMKPIRTVSIVALLFLANVSFALAQGTMTLNVDATDAARNIVHSKLSIPVRPGPLTLIYPSGFPENTVRLGQSTIWWA